MKRLILGVAIMAAIGAAFIAVRAFREQQRRIREIQELRDQVYAARISADSCRNELAYEEGRFRHFTTVVDSLREEVRALEALDARGVPQERYDEYMGHFEGYNDSVATWEGRSEALRAMEQSCRDRVVGHNALTDSLRGRLVEMAADGKATTTR